MHNWDDIVRLALDNPIIRAAVICEERHIWNREQALIEAAIGLSTTYDILKQEYHDYRANDHRPAMIVKP